MAFLLAMPTSEPKVVRGLSCNKLMAYGGGGKEEEDAGALVRMICFSSK